MEYHPHLTAIATCRRTASGGKFKGSLAAQLDILGKAGAAGCQLLYIELQSAAKCKPEQVEASAYPVRPDPFPIMTSGPPRIWT